MVRAVTTPTTRVTERARAIERELGRKGQNDEGHDGTFLKGGGR